MSSNGASTTPVPSTPPCCPRRAQASAVLGHETPRSGDIPRPTSLTAPYIFRKKFRVVTSTSWPTVGPSRSCSLGKRAGTRLFGFRFRFWFWFRSGIAVAADMTLKSDSSFALGGRGLG